MTPSCGVSKDYCLGRKWGPTGQGLGVTSVSDVSEKSYDRGRSTYGGSLGIGRGKERSSKSESHPHVSTFLPREVQVNGDLQVGVYDSRLMTRVDSERERETESEERPVPLSESGEDRLWAQGLRREVVTTYVHRKSTQYGTRGSVSLLALFLTPRRTTRVVPFSRSKRREVGGRSRKVTV